MSYFLIFKFITFIILCCIIFNISLWAHACENSTYIHKKYLHIVKILDKNFFNVLLQYDSGEICEVSLIEFKLNYIKK